LRASRTARGCVAPTTAPDAREAAFADELLAPLRDEARDLVPERPPVGEDEVLDVAAGVRGLDETEEAGAVAAAGGEERLDRVAPEVGADRDRVRPARLEVRGRVGPRRRGHVTALDVGDHEEADLFRVGAHLLERAHAVGSERLEERALRLHRDGVGRGRVDDPSAEAHERVGGALLAAQLDGQQLELRVEPDDELAALPLHRLGQPVGKGDRRDGGSGFHRSLG